MDNVNDNHDEHISFLFEDARNKLRMVVANSDQQKKKIVAELAKNLEGKIRTDTISMEIVNQLRGQVSERFIHECLDEKYKQKVRVENARKQQKQRQEERKVIDKLAAVTPLNQEEEEAEKKEVVMLVDGSTPIQRDENESPSPTTNTSSNIKDRTFDEIPYQSQQEQEQEYQLEKQNDHHDVKEASSCKEIDDEDHETKEIPEKSSQSITVDKLVESSASTYDNDVDTSSNILHFEFPMLFRNIRNYMYPLYSKIGDYGKVWFNGKIDK
ncbi:MAG: hypothetical protein ABJB76_05190, partial [Candidatus Nitrosocosmicus sp.]